MYIYTIDNILHRKDYKLASIGSSARSSRGSETRRSVSAIHIATLGKLIFHFFFFFFFAAERIDQQTRAYIRWLSIVRRKIFSWYAPNGHVRYGRHSLFLVRGLAETFPCPPYGGQSCCQKSDASHYPHRNRPVSTVRRYFEADTFARCHIVRYRHRGHLERVVALLFQGFHWNKFVYLLQKFLGKIPPFVTYTGT